MFSTWLKDVYSSSPNASFGKVLGTAAFVIMVLTNWIVSINPYGWFTNLKFIEQFNNYLFYLAAASYGTTSVKEVLIHIFGGGTGTTDIKNNITTNTTITSNEKDG